MKDFKDLMKDLNYENLEKPEEKEEEIEKFTNEELEEKMGILLRLYEKEAIKRDIYKAQLCEFSYQFNKLCKEHCTADKLLDYFNQISGSIFDVIDN